MPAQPKTRVRPVRIAVPDADITATVLRGVGFRARCDCGWQSRRCKSFRDARAESRAHTASMHAELGLGKAVTW